MGALLALVSSMSWGVADFVGGLAARRAGPALVLSVSYPAGAVLLTVLALFVIPGEITASALRYAAAAGVVGAVAMWLLYSALTRGPMGIVSPLTAVMSGAVPVMVGLVRGESLSVLGMSGIALAALAIIMVSRESGHPHERTPPAAIAYALAGGVAIGLYLTVMGLAPASSGVWVATLGRWESSIGMILFVLVVKRSFPRTGFPWVPALVSGLLDASANGIFQVASHRGLLSIVAVIGSLYPAATVVLARVLLHERMNRVQLSGVVLAFVAVIALTIN